jgi:predicted permease
MLTSVAVLALAIGANTAMFSVLNAVLFRPLPYRAPEQLAMLWSELPSQNIREARSAFWNVEQWRKQSASFSGMAVFDPATVTFTTADRAERISTLRVSPDVFPLLGVQPFAGRTFSVEEAAQRQRVALIGYRFWQSRFGGSVDAIGATIVLDGAPSRIIGILPEPFQFPQLDTDVWEPHTLFPDWETRRAARGSGSWFVLGRLRPDVTLEQAQAEMSAIAHRLQNQSPLSERNRGISVVPLSLQVTGSRARLALWMLAGAVFCVLLIATTNVASLSLARSAGRGREIAIRTALGASRGRIVRQLLVESLTLAAISGLLALLVATWAIRLVVAFQPGDLARLNETTLDLRVLGGALALCLLTGILVGLAPAITVPRSSNAGGGIRRALVVAQFALAITLLVGAGLLTRSLWSVEHVDLGFRPERVLSVQLSTTAFPVPPQRIHGYQRMLEQIESLPGVESAGIIENLFIGGNPEQVITAEGGTAAEQLRLRNDAVSGAFFQTISAPLLKGRFFTAGDGPDSPRVAIVNDALARRLWPGLDPIGRRYTLGSGDRFTVVGMVGNMRRQGLENEPIPQMFVPLAQDPPRLATLVVRTSVDDPLRLLPAVQSAVRRVDKQVPLYDAATLESRLGTFVTERRFQTSLLIGFAAVALLMAAIGIYGLIQYSVTARTREIGIRIAVGAQAGDVFRTIIAEGLKLGLTGLALGLGGALWLGRAGSSLLFGVTATDPLTFLGVSLLLTAVAAAACYFPARRAMKIEPIAALRQE